MPVVGDLSIDDFYLPGDELEARAAVHSLFEFRGNPSTHDVALATRTLRALRDGTEPVPIPVFDKSLRGGKGREEEWGASDAMQHRRGGSCTVCTFHVFIFSCIHIYHCSVVHVV